MADKFDMSEFRSVIEELQGAINSFRMALTGESEATIAEEEAYREQHRRNTEEHRRNTAATKENTTAKKFATAALKTLESGIKAAGREFINVGESGIKLAQQLGVGAVKGVQLEIDNRKVLLSQLKNFNADLAITMEQLKAAQVGFAQAFVGLSAGMQVSAKGSAEFASNLKKGFGSEFEATPETFRMLIDMGMSNVEQMQAFTKASGRAGFSANQLASLYSKNTLSFMLYGNKFAESAIKAEKLGITLQSVQAAQEGLVTNLDGTIDTVNQLNQLGAQLDFETLVRIAETEGPQALLTYVRKVVPEQMMQSASTRALFKQLGISVEDYIRSGERQTSAADNIQKKFEETATEAGDLTKTITKVTRANTILDDVFGDLKKAVEGAIGELYDFIKALIAAGSATVLKSVLPGGRPPGGGPPIPMGRGAMLLRGGTATALAVGGAYAIGSGATDVAEGRTGQGISKGALGGALLGGALLVAAPLTGGASLALLPSVGVLAGGATIGAGLSYAGGKMQQRRDGVQPTGGNPVDLAREFSTPVQDAIFPSGNSRVIMGPEGSFITSKRDTVLAVDLARELSTPVQDAIFPSGNSRVMGPEGSFTTSKRDTVLAIANTPKPPQLNNIIPGITTSTVNTSSQNGDTIELMRKIDRLVDIISTANTTINVGGTVKTMPRVNLVSVFSRNEIG